MKTTPGLSVAGEGVGGGEVIAAISVCHLRRPLIRTPLTAPEVRALRRPGQGKRREPGEAPLRSGPNGGQEGAPTAPGFVPRSAPPSRLHPPVQRSPRLRQEPVPASPMALTDRIEGTRGQRRGRAPRSPVWEGSVWPRAASSPGSTCRRMTLLRLSLCRSPCAASRPGAPCQRVPSGALEDGWREEGGGHRLDLGAIRRGLLLPRGPCGQLSCEVQMSASHGPHRSRGAKHQTHRGASACGPRVATRRGQERLWLPKVPVSLAL